MPRSLGACFSDLSLCLCVVPVALSLCLYVWVWLGCPLPRPASAHLPAGFCTFARRLLHICPWALHICPPASAPASALLPTASAPSLAHLPAGPCTFARRLLHRTWPEVTPPP